VRFRDVSRIRTLNPFFHSLLKLHLGFHDTASATPSEPGRAGGGVADVVSSVRLFYPYKAMVSKPEVDLPDHTCASGTSPGTARGLAPLYSLLKLHLGFHDTASATPREAPSDGS